MSAYAFAGGVRDLAGERAFVAIGARGVAAVALADGALLWRRNEVGRPVAATTSRLLAVDRDADGFFVRLLDAQTGEEVATLRPPGLSAAEKPPGADLDTLDVEALPAASGVQLAWNVRPLYRGGAPPPRELAPTAQQSSSGTLVIDPDAGRILPDVDVARPPPMRSVESQPESTPEPDVIARRKIGGRSFSLKTQPAGATRSLVLEARDAQDGPPLWTTVLSDVVRESPTPPRPKGPRP